MSIGITVELKVEDIANSIKKLKKEDCRNMICIFSNRRWHLDAWSFMPKTPDFKSYK